MKRFHIHVYVSDLDTCRHARSDKKWVIDPRVSLTRW